MGRRVRANCSPIDSAMEKYHNDIGNRLSGVFMPTHPTPGAEEHLSEDFCMLTLDTRHLSSIKNKNNGSNSIINVNAATEMNKAPTDVSSSTPSAAGQASSTTASSSSSIAHSEQENLPKEKKRLVDKLTRALFQRKHMCARCKRRSRSCMPNKTFNSTEKHYTCGRCREHCDAMKNLFTGKPSATNSENSDFAPLKHSSSFRMPRNNDRVMPKPRTHLNDSGYETVTSCSTVASAYSAFNCPSHTNPNANTEDGIAKPTHLESQQLSSKRNSDTPIVKESNVKSDAILLAHCVCSGHEATSDNGVNSDSEELYQFLGVGQPGSTVGVLRQVKHRTVRNYDGYLPEVDHHGEDLCPVRQALTDATNFEGRVCHGDFTPENNTHVSRESSENLPKACYTCGATSKPCFRLPWVGGWLCEDCMDGMY